jgi:hypothetical protein
VYNYQNIRKEGIVSKNPISAETLKKIIYTTQLIEGYQPANSDVVKKVQDLKNRYGIKVSPRK